jgi:hypothetical protein
MPEATVGFHYHLGEQKTEESPTPLQNMGRGGFDLPDSLILLVIVGVIAAVGVKVLNAFAATSTFSGSFHNTAFSFLGLAATALVLGVGAVGTIVGYLVWFAGSEYGR